MQQAVLREGFSHGVLGLWHTTWPRLAAAPQLSPMLIVPTTHDHNVSFLGFTVLLAVSSLGHWNWNGCKQSRTCPGVHVYPEMGVLSHRREQTLPKPVQEA